jgi:AAA family ATP:ADP antiporter
MSTDKTKTPEFTGLRAILWPIHNYELKKFLPMGLMMFCALFNYTIVRDLKDAMVVKGISAESISYIKLGVVLPFSLLFVILYNKMSNSLSRINLFNFTVIPFLLFFGLFGFYWYPNRASILPDPASIDLLMSDLPFHFLGFFVKIYSQWIIALFYALAELWGSVILGVLFWQFANTITRVFEAKRYYALFGLIGNFGLVASGEVLKQLTKIGGGASNVNVFEASLQYITGAFLIFGVLFMYLHYWTTKNVMSDPRLYDPAEKKAQKQKLKLSFMESLKVICSSKYLWLIFLIIMGYGISINLVEVTWKKMLGIQFTNENDYTAFMGQFSQYTGLVTILFMFIAQNILRILGWRKAALMTPIMILITGGIFFVVALNRDVISEMAFFAAIISNPVMLAIWMGQIQNILSKATKYSLFDSTKEMSYIPLDDELKIKGKAAVDVIGGRFSKAGGSMIQIGLMAALGISAADPMGQLKIAPYLFIFLLIIVIAWIYAVIGLNKAFEEKQAEQAEQAKKK